MTKKVGSHGAADPDRLAIFAVQSLISMLDDADEVSLVRLNGALENESPPPIRPLAANRSQILDLLDTKEGPVAKYGGQYTPCRSSLNQVAKLLHAAYRAGVPQVVMFLTDGACTGADHETPNPKDFLNGLQSERDDLFQLYLLRFRGRPYTRELEELASLSGGQAIEVASDDPTSILEPFADALTRSQGYEAELLTPSRFQLAAHRGARRVRLLAVAKGDGPELRFKIRDQQGKRPDLMDTAEPGRHRYADGGIYRYVTLDYRPGTTPVNIEVDGAERNWKVVAVPEYRLFVRTEIRRGPCASPGEVILGAVETGASVCVVARLENHEGKMIHDNVTGGDIQALVRFHKDDSPAKSLPMNPLGGAAAYGFDYQNIERGFWRIQPSLEIQLVGQSRKLTLSTPIRSLQAATVKIEAKPARLDFGPLRPGDAPSGQTIAFNGNYTPTNGRLELADRSGVPSCVVFRLSDIPEETPVLIADTQPYSLAVRVAPYCGPDTFQNTYDTDLRLVFDRTADGQQLPPVLIPVRFQLAYQIELPKEIKLEVEAARSEILNLEIGGNQTRPLAMKAMVDEPWDGWPRRDLELGFASEEDARRFIDQRPVTFDPSSGQAAPLSVRAQAGKCCGSGTYQTRVGLVPADLSVYSGEPPAPVMVPVTVVVHGAGLLRCQGELIGWILLILLILLILTYLYLMYRNSYFLRLELLGKNLSPLYWGTYGDVLRRPRMEQQVTTMIRRGMSFRQRAEAWLKANPLKFGLPGGRYNETVELVLQPELSPDRSSVTLVGERDHYGRSQTDPEQVMGRMFATAQGRESHRFYAVPRHGYLIGRLAPERLMHLMSFEDENGRKNKVISLKKREKLVHAIDADEREEGRAAGWQLG